MRDLFVLVVVLGSLPLILRRPWVGILVWGWLSYMNPHRLTWGFAADFPFAQIVALTVLVAVLVSREPKKIPWLQPTVVLLVFVLWMVVTTLTAVREEVAVLQLEKVLKIQLMTFVTLMLITTRERVDALVWVIVLSLGFYGIKGGIFTLLTGGGYHVFGPMGTFIGGNNEIGLALIMTIPLMRYLQLRTDRPWLRWGLLGATGWTLVAILGTQSRGAFVGISAMLLFLMWKSRKRVTLLFVLVLLVPLALSVMPDSWFERMESIQHYEEDASAQGRFQAWNFAMNVASERPLVGGGFEVFRGRTDAHSIYFEVLGEHGYVGLLLFLWLGFATWRTGTLIISKAAVSPDLKWAGDLARMLQVSMVGYASSGAFLGLAYFDLYYHIVALMIMVRVIAERHSVESSSAAQVSLKDHVAPDYRKPHRGPRRPYSNPS